MTLLVLLLLLVGPYLLLTLAGRLTDGFKTEPKAVVRLGSEGWEMVAPGALDVRQGASNALYFERPNP